MSDRFRHAQMNLPSPPAIAMRILQAVKAREASFRDLGKIIAADQALYQSKRGGRNRVTAQAPPAR